jgi:hypothetical protein
MRGLSAFYCLTTAKIICRSFFLHSQHSLLALSLTRFDQVSSGKSSSVSDQNDREVREESKELEKTLAWVFG